MTFGAWFLKWRNIRSKVTPIPGKQFWAPSVHLTPVWLKNSCSLLTNKLLLEMNSAKCCLLTAWQQSLGNWYLWFCGNVILLYNCNLVIRMFKLFINHVLDHSVGLSVQFLQCFYGLQVFICEYFLCAEPTNSPRSRIWRCISKSNLISLGKASFLEHLGRRLHIGVHLPQTEILLPDVALNLYDDSATLLEPSKLK